MSYTKIFRKQIGWRFLLVMLLFINAQLSFGGNFSHKEAKNATDKPVIIIFAEPHLAKFVTDITRLESIKENQQFSVFYDSIDNIIQKLNNGAEGNIFISDNPYWIDRLRNNGLIDVYNIVNLAKDNVVIFRKKSDEKVVTKLTPKNLDYFLAKNQVVITNDNFSSLFIYSNHILNQISKNNTSTYNIKSVDNVEKYIAYSNSSDDKDVEIIGFGLHSKIENDTRFEILYSFDKSPFEQVLHQVAIISDNNMDISREIVLKMKDSQALRDLIKQNRLIPILE